MPYPFTDEHEMIRAAARGWLEAWYCEGQGPASVAQSGFDSAAWQRFGAIQGFAAIAIEEAYGGAGQGALGRAVILEEIGRTAFAGPFFGSCCLAAELLQRFADDECRGKILPKIAAGEVIIAVVDGVDDGQSPPRQVSGLHLSDGQISGTVNIVLDAMEADLFLLLVPDGDDCILYLSDHAVSGLEVTALQGLDESFRRGAVTVDRLAPGSAVTQIGRAAATDIRRALVTAYGALGALCVGGAQRCLDMTLAYTAQRVQFDRPIASFQAIKHRCADMFVKLEAARSAAYHAAMASAGECYEAALIARTSCAEAYFEIAADAIQLHGGIGFTWEYPLHYFFKQAQLLKSFLLPVPQAFDRLGDEIGLVPRLTPLPAPLSVSQKEVS